MKPGTVSLEKFTKRSRSCLDGGLQDVERAQQVVPEHDMRRVVNRLGDRRGVHDHVAVTCQRVRGARVREIRLPVVLGLAGVDWIPHGPRQIARAHVDPALRAVV